LTLRLNAAPPPWWKQWGATDNQNPDEQAAANIGQLKHIASKAIAEFEVNLPGGAGTSLNTMLAGWKGVGGPERDDTVAVTVGQLKSVAKLVYDRLIQVGYTTTYPWTPETDDDDDTAIVNLGQIKYVFRFDLQKDANHNGIPDWQDAVMNSLTLDSDGDGMSNRDEKLAGRNPFKRDDPAVKLQVEVIIR
jgi:hypothetical protein